MLFEALGVSICSGSGLRYQSRSEVGVYGQGFRGFISVDLGPGRDEVA